MLFFRFMMSLAIGLVGLCMVLKTVLETLLADWDILADIRLIIHDPKVLREAMRGGKPHPEAVEASPARLSTRLDPYLRSSKVEKADRRPALLDGPR